MGIIVNILLLVLLIESLPVLGTKTRHSNEQNASLMKTTTNSKINIKPNKLTDNDIPWRQIKFISPQQSLSQSRWHSGLQSFSGKGMDHLYMLTQFAINSLQTPGLPSGFINEQLFDNPIPVLKENRGRLLTHFWGLILMATILLCIAILVPLIGLICCCCCCSSDKHSRRAKTTNYSSSSSSSPVRRIVNKKKRYKVDGTCDPCFRALSGFNLFILLLLMSFFVICAFVTNEYIRTGVHELPKTLNQSTDDLMLYLNNTQYEVNTLLITNFQQLEQELGESLDRSGSIVKNRLAVLSEAASLENLTDIVSKLDSILVDLRDLSGDTNELRLLTVQLQSRLSRSKNDLEQFLLQCRDRVCADLKYRYNRILDSFSVSTRIDDLPDLSPLMLNISNLLNADIVKEIKKGKEAFDEISFRIQSTVNKTIPDIKIQIKAVGSELSAAASDINEGLRRPFVDLYKVKSNVNIGQKYINDYEIYRWYSCLIGSAIVFFILICWTLGLLSGSCSQQPTRHHYKRRSKSSTRFFKCGIVLLFLLFLPLLLGTIILFLIGGVSDKVFCYYLENPSRPQSRQVFSILQNKFEQMSYAESMNVIQGVKPNFADVVTRCHQNLSLYNVLQLNQYNQIQINSGRTINNVNISEILAFKDRYRIEEKMNKFLESVDVNPSNVVLLTSDGFQLLENLKQTSLGTLNFSSYANVIKNSITPLDLVSISNELEQEANRLPKNDYENIAKLRNIAMDLKIPINLVTRIKETIETLTAGAEKIEKKANYGNKGLKEALTSLLKQAEDAQKFIAVKGRSEIQTVTKAFVSDMSSLVDQYAEHVVEEIETGIGKCEPVSRAVNASVQNLCKDIVLPFNGFWSSMASALILCIPSAIFAYILSQLYKKVKRFPSRRESDSTLDNLDEDDIPLAHVDNKSHSSEGRGRPTPSAPLPIGHDNRSDDDNWSPGALPPHLYGSRPPPYNFVD